MSVTRTVVLVVALLPVMAGAQATVSGDVYAVNGLGQTLRATGMLVVVIRRTPESAALAASLCRMVHAKDGKAAEVAFLTLTGGVDDPTFVQFEPRNAHEIRDRVLAVRDSLSTYVVDTVRTSVDGHYSIDSVAAGAYWVESEGRFAHTYAQWWRPIVVTTSPVTADLNPPAMTNGLYCIGH